MRLLSASQVAYMALERRSIDLTARRLSRSVLLLLCTVALTSALDLSGFVLNPDSTGKVGVSIKLASSGATVTTNAEGAWSLSGRTGVEHLGATEKLVADRLILYSGRLRLSYRGHNVFGRSQHDQEAFTRHSRSAARSAGVSVDTLIYSYGGKVFLRDTASESRSGIIRIYDTTWNPLIIYGYLTDSRDRQVYRTVKIGSQTWMAENLNYKVDSSWWYENNVDSGSKYGRLYTWASSLALPDSCKTKKCANQVQPKQQGVCPNEWHVPSDSEWSTLIAYVGGENVASKKLRSRVGSNTNGGGTDEYGFSILPAGYRYYGGSFDKIGSYGDFWSSSENDAMIAWCLFFLNGYAGVFRASDIKPNGYSIRCVED